MQLAHCCEIFDIFIFILVPSRTVDCDSFSHSPRVCRHFTLSVPFRTPLALLLCAFDVHRMQFRGMQQKKSKTATKTQQQFIVFTTKIFHSLLWWNIILAKRAVKKSCEKQQKSAMKYVCLPLRLCTPPQRRRTVIFVLIFFCHPPILKSFYISYYKQLQSISLMRSFHGCIFSALGATWCKPSCCMCEWKLSRWANYLWSNAVRGLWWIYVIAAYNKHCTTVLIKLQ